ncbi:2-dehydro-3-deoxygalactonokinase [Sulfitobacter sp. HNIBRBA3233]|uniref:2-dehydro-3-deoxygalactonokinase n=1 Tax=Sulfitobacter marinivivus TaxID=3158558 RepID=UPI0032DFE926
MTVWIAADWGNSHLRAWLMDGDAPRESMVSQDGARGLTREGFEPALLRLVEPHLPAGTPVDVIACGAVGAREGWCEVPYRKLPAVPPGFDGAITAPVRDARLAVHLLAGVSQDSPAAVMRGEETQIAGFLAANPGWDGVICLPGTHSVWAHISAGEIVSFRSFLTGELFALISQQSVLRHTMAGHTGQEGAESVFLEAMSDAMSRPERVAADLFSLRAGALLHGLDPAEARARLSGMLIGQELAAARPYWLGQRVAIIGTDGLSARYGAALATQGVVAETAEAGATTLRGLVAAWHGMQRAMTR